MVSVQRPLLVLTVALVFATSMAPVGSATESITASYTLGGFRILGVGPSFLWGGDLTGDGENDFGPIGGASLEPEALYHNVIVSTNDDLFGTNTGSIVRMWDPNNDELVQDPYSSGEGCGTQVLIGSPYASNDVSVHMYSLVVMDDLETCGATTGTLTGDFF